MQKVIIDSSVWLSNLAEDSKSHIARKLLKRLFGGKDGRKILVPRIIYLEVVNNLRRLKSSDLEIAEFKNIFKSKSKNKIQLVKTDEKIYIKAEQLGLKVQLKTLDLLILTTVDELKINRFYTFDKKLRKAYYLIKH